MNYYIAKVFIRHCLVDIRINDVPLLRQNVDADLTAEMPINYLIESSGQQMLTVQMYPELGSASLLQGAKCSVVIWRYDGSGIKIVPIEQICASSLSVSGAENTIPLKYEKMLFFAQVSYRITRWSDCEEIKDSRKIAPAVATFYQEIGQMLANRQYDQYLQYVRDREWNICTALSLDEKEINKRNDLLFECLDGGFVLQPMKGNRLQFYSDKRIVTVLYKDMRPALRFYNEETGEMLAIELLLGIKKGQRELSVI